MRDLLHTAWYYIHENGENILKGVICAFLLLFSLLLQTTFFVRFAPFGAIPDLLLSLTAAIAVAEGEQWGAVFGLCAAFLSEALGGSPGAPVLLPLLYMPAGYFCGLCSEYYLSDSIPVRGLYILACGAGRAVITAITAACVLSATLPQIFFRHVLPEFLSTVVIAPVIYAIVYLIFRPFHKSRAERTDAIL